jgi:hypothetical protein
LECIFSGEESIPPSEKKYFQKFAKPTFTAVSGNIMLFRMCKIGNDCHVKNESLYAYVG